ncbi:MAG: hypothetical protein Q7W45_03135 [Bacteroidota bacterium]|nr:hypothetical protein [Bacteroidota bacterium]MDP3145752.1 hypothetical protein [Bacteroidota bacterium]MDP3556839.1 hypothetical protein [Bacteroidota bacterium]
MKKDHVPSGSDVSAGTFECTKCGNVIKVQSISSLPPCGKCHNGDWKVLTGKGDAEVDPYPKS